MPEKIPLRHHLRLGVELGAERAADVGFLAGGVRMQAGAFQPLLAGLAVNDVTEDLVHLRRADAALFITVLLYCGDHDPGGLNISQTLKKNFKDLEQAVAWNVGNLTIDRFGLNFAFIKKQKLSWIDKLETSTGGRLDDPRHSDHQKAYVQDYTRKYGVRKCEANALVVRPEAGRQLCRDAILRYLDQDSITKYKAWLHKQRALAVAALPGALRAMLEGKVEQ
jgi:hypothetical protein